MVAESGQSRGLNRDSRASRSHCARSLSLTRVGTWTRRTTYKSPRPRFAASRQSELLSFAHARRNFHLIIFELRRLPAAAALRTSPVIDFAAPAATRAGHIAAKRNRTDRALQRFFQRHHDVGFHV